MLLSEDSLHILYIDISLSNIVKDFSFLMMLTSFSVMEHHLAEIFFDYKNTILVF